MGKYITRNAFISSNLLDYFYTRGKVFTLKIYNISGSSEMKQESF